MCQNATRRGRVCVKTRRDWLDAPRVSDSLFRAYIQLGAVTIVTWLEFAVEK